MIAAQASATRVPKAAGPGMPGADSVRVIPAAPGLEVVASSVPLGAYGTEAIERGLKDMNWVSSCALAHEAVVEAFAKKYTTLPMKLFTLFASDARAVDHIRAQRPKIARALDRTAGCSEWGVRLTYEPTRARRLATERVARGAPAASGASFLAQKKSVQDASRVRLADAQAHAGELFATLGALARESRKQPIPPQPTGARVLLDGAFLVADADREAFARRVNEASARLAPDGYQLVFTGPWPAYNFVAERKR